MWGAAASGIGSAAASAVGTAAGDDTYKYAKEIINNLSCKVDNEADYDLEYNYVRLIGQAKKLYACRDGILAQAKTKLATQVYEAWISRVTESEEEVRDLETKYKKEKRNKRTWSQLFLRSSKSRIDLSQSMAEKCKKLHNLWVEGKSEIGIAVEKLPERVIIMHGPKSEDKIFLDSTVEEILGHLRDKNVKRIGLWGMSGIGKTTIMQSLNNNEDTAKMFDIVIWLTVSKDWNLEKFQHKIADRLKLNMEGITDPNEIAHLICRDLKSKRCLLLLDEVREVLDLPLIGMCESENDSKVVVATRNHHVCCDMETDLEINVQQLSEADAWKMFKVKVGRNVNLPGIEPVAKLVVSECAGLPLLIDKVASMFRRKDSFHLWSDGLRSLRRYTSIKIQGIDELIEKLKFCYEDLDDEVKKVCFLYVAIYPEDYEIYIDYLLECWRAEGFIHDTSEFRVARDKGHSILEELISVSLLEKSAKMNHVRMNKVIRNMALKISSQSCNFKILVKPREGLQEAPNEVEWQQANRISLMDNKLCTLPEMPDCNELSTLLLQRNQDLKVIPESFFGCMQNLRVLDLHGTGITSLPSSISCLKCLKALYLHSCSCLMELRYLEGLEHLEVLDIRDTSLNHFPIQIGHLNQLKCLRMSLSNFGIRHSSNVEYCRNVFSSLLLLEELLIDVDPNNQSWEVTIKAIFEGVAKLMHLTSLSICFPTVDCLESFISTSQLWKAFHFTFRISVGYHDMTLYKFPDCFEYQIRKCLKFANGEGVDPIISEVLLETEAFELIGHKGTSSLSDFGIESINKMRGCLIEGCNEIETIVDGNRVERSALICLEKMFINNVPNLKSIWEGPVHNGSLSQLTTLTLCKCLTLKKIFSGGMIKQLSQLQHLKVEDCPEIEEIIAESENNGLKPDALPSLKMLELSNLPRVKSIWTCDSLKWPSLEKIKISMCQMLTKLPFNSENAINLRCIEAHQTWWSALACQDDAIEQRLKSLWGGRSEGQTKLDPQGVWLDDKAVEMNQMTSNSSVEMKFEVKEIGYEASQRQSEFIQDEEMEQGISTLKPQAVDMTSNLSERTKFEIEEIVNEASQKQPEFIQDEEMEQAISTLKPVEVVFDVDALKMPRSSGQMEFQIKDNEMEPETDRPEESRKFLMKGGLGLTEPPKDEDWENAKVMNLMDNELSVLPENPRCPKLSALFLKRNYKLRMIPPPFFDYMPALQILNLSRTSIKSLPDSISRLFSLKRLFLNDCHRFMRLSPKVGELKQLEVLDLEGTEIMDLPHEIQKLTNLTCFEVSFYGYKSDGRKATQSSAMVPCGVISALSNLEELNIDVNPDAEQWDACVEAIVAEVCSLKNLNMLKFYFPRMELLSHIQCKIPALLYFQFIVGRHVKRIVSRVPRDVEFELERWERCLKYINGMSVPRDIRKVLQHATAFFLDRHATVKKLSDFGIQNMEKLKCLVVGECNKLQVIIDEADGYKEDDSNENVSESYGTEKFVLGSLEYLYIYYMRSLRSIWEGSVQQNSLSLLKSLTLCTCPKLTTIFTQGLLNNLCKLEELNVEDCASINSIVCFDISVEHKTTSFLPNLKKISLHDMPGLASIFGGLHIAPKLEWLSFYKCPKLKNPLIDEVSTQNLKRIKGLKSWWDALEWINGRPGYLDKIFVPINIWDC